MPSRAVGLDPFRDHIVSTGSAFLRNVRWTPHVTCRTCTGIPNPGYVDCYKCHGRAASSGLADTLGFVTYAWPDSQAGRTMRAYKDGGSTSYELVASLLTYAVAAHWDCIAARTGSHPDAWAYVPSLAGRRGQHPLARIASAILGRIPHVQVVANTYDDDPRAFNAAHFTAPPTPATHVLLLDDTWTTGGHLQSVSAALKAQGVRRVTGLVIARWLDPNWSTTKTFIGELSQDFDPMLCPYTGAPC